MKKHSTDWFLFLASLAGRHASTARVRLWRALKELGAATLRDGVSLLPATEEHRLKLTTIGRQLEEEGGVYWLLELPTQTDEVETTLRAAFDRSDSYQGLLTNLEGLHAEMPQLQEVDARRRLRQAERELAGIIAIDFFPGEMQPACRQALAELSGLADQLFSPREPATQPGGIERLERDDYRGRCWATRRRLWVDRVASAWLIRRFIDPEARFLWLETSRDCPADALGFDFDGAAFTHVEERVTFEVLLASFGLEADPGLLRLGRLIHYLDVGGAPVAEAAGFEAVLAGLRENMAEDDALLRATTPVLDALYRRFSTQDN